MPHMRIGPGLSESSLNVSYPVETRWLLVILLSRARKGVCKINTHPDILARICNITPESARLAIEQLLAPDPASQVSGPGGARLVQLPDGFQIVDHERYVLARQKPTPGNSVPTGWDDGGEHVYQVWIKRFGERETAGNALSWRRALARIHREYDLSWTEIESLSRWIFADVVEGTGRWRGWSAVVHSPARLLHSRNQDDTPKIEKILPLWRRSQQRRVTGVRSERDTQLMESAAMMGYNSYTDSHGRDCSLSDEEIRGIQADLKRRGVI